MTWNYRVIRRARDAHSEEYFAIHECHYAERDDTVPNSWADEPAVVMSDTRVGLCWSLGRMVEAISKPVLEIRDGKLVEVET